MARPQPPSPARLSPTETPVWVAPSHWQAIDFISDLHLAESTPRAFDAFAAHLRHTPADAVLILGDLFEMWVGDDVDARSFERRCIDVMGAAAKHRTIGFMAGNRDFLVGDGLLASSGVMRLADPSVIEAFGTRLLASHGDALCLADTAYQRYRGVVRRPRLQRMFLALPRRAREAVGRGLRGGGRPTKPMRDFIDLDAAATTSGMDASGATVLVHGHTHAPASHRLADGRMRHVMTDWQLDEPGPERAETLRWRAGGIERVPLAGASAASPGATP